MHLKRVASFPVRQVSLQKPRSEFWRQQRWALLLIEEIIVVKSRASAFQLIHTVFKHSSINFPLQLSSDNCVLLWAGPSLMPGAHHTLPIDLNSRLLRIAAFLCLFQLIPFCLLGLVGLWSCRAVFLKLYSFTT